MASPTKLRPKLTADVELPGLGDQYEVALANVGYSLITATLGLSILTDVQLVALPPNGSAIGATNVVQHSLGTTPAFYMAQALGSVRANFMPVTADNSAVYIRAFESQSSGTLLMGVGAHVLVIR